MRPKVSGQPLTPDLMLDGVRLATAAIVGIGKGSLAILAVMILTTCCVGFWALAGGLMLASGVILACGMMALQIIRRWRNG
jgi:hypothetical protein